MTDKTMINEYLFYEFGYDLQQPPPIISDDSPFELKAVGVIRSDTEEIEVFEFVADGEAHFALSGSTLTFYPVAGMNLGDLQLQHDGSAWIARQDPVDLATSRLGDELVPPLTQRQAAIKALAAGVSEAPRILEGLYLRVSRAYLALVEDPRTGSATVIGNNIEPDTAAFPQASSWRRLTYSVGKMLKEGSLK